MGNLKYKKEELKRLLINFSLNSGKIFISQKEVDEDENLPSSSTYKRYFGSWKTVLEIVGLKSGIITGRPQDPIITLNDTAFEIITGELLGDGSIFFTGSKANACFSHSTANIDYGEYLYNKLKINNVPLLKKEYLPSRNNNKPQFRTRTCSNSYWSNLHHQWYKGNKKIVPDIKLTKEICLHWFLGDGYFEVGTCKISTCSFTYEENKKLANLLTEIGFKASFNKRSGNYYIIRFSKNSFQSFLNWIGDPVKGYEHRWGK